MFIVNIEQLSIADERLFTCNGVIANWLMADCGVPPLGRKGNNYCFMKTKELEDHLKNIPFWLNINRLF